MTTTIILVSGTTWSVPSDWTSSGATIECLGSGGNGFLSNGSAPFNGGGGQGGGYGKVTSPSNINASDSLTIQIGAGGSTNPCFLKDNTSTIICQGDYGASATSELGANRSQTNTGAAQTYAGGNGGSSTQGTGRGAGGGGAAGPNGAGGAGGGSSAANAGGGGGGSGGGSAGASPVVVSVGAAGGANFTASQAGGAGGVGGASPGNGTGDTNGASGGGGGGGGGIGGTGGAGKEWDATHGSGGGGGGGPNNGGAGGAGGTYGGGGGGAGFNSGAGGAGGAGIIVITYTPGSGGGAPFFQTDWPVPPAPSRLGSIAAQVLGTALLLTTLVAQDNLPFRQRDWPLPTPARVVSIGVNSQPLGSPDNLTLFPGLDFFPFRQREWPIPRGSGPPQQPIVDGSFAALRTVIVPPPFFQNEWPIPRAAIRYDAVLGQPLGSPDNLTLFPGLDFFAFSQHEWPVPKGPLQPTQTQPYGSGLAITTVPPTPYLMAQWDWPNPRAPQQPWQITTWNVPLSILVTIPPDVVFVDTHDGGEKRRRAHEKQKKKEVGEDRERDERRRAQIIAAFEQVIEGSVSRETSIEQIIAPAAKMAVESPEVQQKTDFDFARWIENLDNAKRILDDYLEADDEEILLLL